MWRGGSRTTRPSCSPTVMASPDLDLAALMAFHHAHGKLATVTTVRSPARFGRITFDGNRIATFYEKPQAGEGWINGGYFLLNRRVLDYIDSDDTVWERDPVEHMAQDGELMGYQHYGFWSCMDTLKEKMSWKNSGTAEAPWKIW